MAGTFSVNLGRTASDASRRLNIRKLSDNEYPVTVSWGESWWYASGSTGGVTCWLCDSGGGNKIQLFSESWSGGNHGVAAGSRTINATALKGKTLAVEIAAGNAANQTEAFTVSGTTKSDYTVRWLNGSTVLQSATVTEGSTPSYTGATPTKSPDAQYSYSFSGWYPAIGPISGNTDYYAQFTNTLKQYTVIWKNYDGTELARETLDYGTVPARDGPERQPDAEHSYVFTGWSPSITAVTGDAVYTATYSTSTNTYTITWLQDDGTLIDTTQVAYGAMPTHDDPTKPPDASYSYTFKEWSPALSAVTGNATYTAVYTQISQHRTVKYWDGRVWDECYMQYYDGSDWVEVEPWYYNGSTWVLCSQT